MRRCVFVLLTLCAVAGVAGAQVVPDKLMYPAWPESIARSDSSLKVVENWYAETMSVLIVANTANADTNAITWSGSFDGTTWVKIDSTKTAGSGNGANQVMFRKYMQHSMGTVQDSTLTTLRYPMVYPYWKFCIKNREDATQNGAHAISNIRMWVGRF